MQIINSIKIISVITKSNRQTLLLLVLFLLFTVSASIYPSPIIAGPASSHYEMREYGFGAGGTAGSSSNTYSLFGIAGEEDQGNPSSSHYAAKAGLTYTIISNVPPSPTLTNPGSSYYNKLHLVINNGSNPTDAQFAIEISTDAFATVIKYVKSDHSVGTTLVSGDWQSYATWGSSSGFDIIGLSPGTTYTVRVAARQGNYTQSPYGPNSASTATVNPTLSFSLSTTTVQINNMVAGTVTAGNTTVTSSISTNGTGGGTIYVSDNNQGLLSAITGHKINAVTSNLTSTSEGYGLRGTTSTQSSGGPMEILSPYNGVSNNVGMITATKTPIFDSNGAPVTSGSGTFEVKAKVANTTQSSNDYTDVLTLVAAGSF